MIGHPIPVKQAIELNLSLAVQALISPPIDRLKVRHYLREALRFSYWAGPLVFFEGDHSEWLTLTTDAVVDLATEATDTVRYVPVLLTFLEASVDSVIDRHLRRLCSRGDSPRQFKGCAIWGLRRHPCSAIFARCAYSFPPSLLANDP